MYPHRIRLRGPWECEPLACLDENDARPLPPKERVNLPCRWGMSGLGDFAGRVCFVRRFGQPRQLDAFEGVWLTFEGVERTAEVWLNGEYLGQHEGAGAFEFDVTSWLQARNELRVEVMAPDGSGGLWGEVALEVRCLAYLRAVQAWMAAEGGALRLHVRGEVVGAFNQPLELYVLLNNGTIAYTTVQAAPEGKSFEVVSEGLAPEHLLPGSAGVGRLPVIGVELVNGAVVWYRVELRLEARVD